MNVFQVLPRRMGFEANRSTSVELCVSEWVAGSRFRETTTVVAEVGGAPLLPVRIFRLPPARRLTSWRAAIAIRREALNSGCQIIVAQQHIATAARYAMIIPEIPVVLQTHNLIDPPRSGRFAQPYNTIVRRRLNRLAGITLVSEASRRDFEQNWPMVEVPRAVITNGFDFSGWNPAVARDRAIIVVGRAREEKGLLEAAEGVAVFLRSHLEWSAAFAISEKDGDRGYYAAIQAALSICGDRVRLLTQVPYPMVKALTERAAIAIVPSKWREPFGRTALEAHAGGAALISSGTGGLREISGDCAYYIGEVSGDAIATALETLATNAPLRESLAADGARRVRKLFRLSAPGQESDVKPICERLDDFYEEVLANWRRRRQ